MGILNVLPVVISNAPKFRYLAIFICHLFASGSFRTVHIVYHPNAFDHDILTQINSICTDPVPIYLTNIDQPFKIPYQKCDTFDNILQIIFLDPEHLADEIEQFGGENFALYRIFVFSSIDIINRIDQNLLFKTKNRILDIRTLILHYDESSVSVYIESEQSNENVIVIQEPIFILNEETDIGIVNIFEKTFGVYERMESIDIYRLDYYYISPNNLRPSLYLEDIFINYNHFQLKRSFINIMWLNKFNLAQSKIYHRNVIENPPKYYKEKTLNYKLIEDETQ